MFDISRFEVLRGLQQLYQTPFFVPVLTVLDGPVVQKQEEQARMLILRALLPFLEKVPIQKQHVGSAVYLSRA